MTNTQNNTLINNLIEIICEDNLLSSHQREVLIQTVLVLSTGKN